MSNAQDNPNIEARANAKAELSTAVQRYLRALRAHDIAYLRLAESRLSLPSPQYSKALDVHDRTYLELSGSRRNLISLIKPGSKFVSNVDYITYLVHLDADGILKAEVVEFIHCEDKPGGV